MKVVRTLAALLGMMSICYASEPQEGHLRRIPWPDHLWPVEYPGKEEKIYREYIEKRLCLTRFNCGRLVEMPPFGKSELSISAYSGKNGKYYVTFVDAADNLRDSTDAGRLPARAKNVKVRRIDAEVPAATAVLLRDLWTQMLSGRQAPRKDKVDSEVMYGDSTEGEFSIQLTSGKVLRGEAELIPDLGQNTAAFVHTAEQLSEYCKAKPSNRDAVLNSIERKTKEVLERFKSRR